MKYEIEKKYFDFIILELIAFGEKFRLNPYTDYKSVKQLDDLVDTLRYYRQFSKWWRNMLNVSLRTNTFKGAREII